MTNSAFFLFLSSFSHIHLARFYFFFFRKILRSQSIEAQNIGCFNFGKVISICSHDAYKYNMYDYCPMFIVHLHYIYIYYIHILWHIVYSVRESWGYGLCVCERWIKTNCHFIFYYESINFRRKRKLQWHFCAHSRFISLLLHISHSPLVVFIHSALELLDIFHNFSIFPFI